MNKFQENPKFRQIVLQGRRLFYRFGIKRVSVEEICKTAQVSKMTFYKFFPNKIELAKYIFTELMDKNEIKYDQIMSSDLSFAEKTDRVIQLKLDSMNDMSNELIRELLIADPEIQQLFDQRRQLFYQKMIAQYKEAQKNGEIRADIRPEFILYLLNALTELTKDEKLLSLYPDLTELVKEITQFFFYGISAEKRSAGRLMK